VVVWDWALTCTTYKIIHAQKTCDLISVKSSRTCIRECTMFVIIHKMVQRAVRGFVEESERKSKDLCNKRSLDGA
jgi:hypothetical protein